MNEEHELSEIEHELLAFRPLKPDGGVRHRVADSLESPSVSPAKPVHDPQHSHRNRVAGMLSLAAAAAVLIAALVWLMWPMGRQERVEDSRQPGEHQDAKPFLRNDGLRNSEPGDRNGDDQPAGNRSLADENIADARQSPDMTPPYVTPTWQSLMQALSASSQTNTNSADDADWLPPIPPLTSSVAPRFGYGGGF